MPEQSTLRVLVADDELLFREFVSLNLRKRGYVVQEAANGREALALWEREGTDLFIVDIVMPHIDGLEVCRRVRTQSTVPIIVVTALDTATERHIAAEFAVDAYLMKPFGVEELLSTMRAVLQSYKPLDDTHQ